MVAMIVSMIFWVIRVPFTIAYYIVKKVGDWLLKILHPAKEEGIWKILHWIVYIPMYASLQTIIVVLWILVEILNALAKNADDYA